MAVRTLCLWCPDWPVVAARAVGAAPADGPVAIVEQQRVRAVSADAREDGVRIGTRRREAEAACPGITVLDADGAAEARTFEPVARAVEAITPRLVIDRPGLLAFPTRGPSRYHGGDGGLVDHVRDAVAAAGGGRRALRGGRRRFRGPARGPPGGDRARG